ncbi:MAG: twin-arginine translocase subunit TatB [Betaproteobacteria bacterium]|nr:twin-arginine translocase subunit TatB [Betaproteobacteria bacterium]
MFNISFGEVCLIVTVGLIVIGPQRLPETARVLGHLIARVQRQAAGVKADIRREMDLEDLKSIHSEYKTAARNAEQSFNEQAQKIRTAVEETPKEKTPEEEKPENAPADSSAPAQR